MTQTCETCKFPAPTGEWGTVTHVLIPNPRWRWWAFWRPKAVTMWIPPTEVQVIESLIECGGVTVLEVPPTAQR